MDSKEDISFGGSVRNDGAPQGFYIGSRAEYPNTQQQQQQQQPGPPNMVGSIQPVHLPGASISNLGKKKMGRPRKYAPDGAPLTALSPMPISASIPLSGDFSGWKQPKARPFPAAKKAHKGDVENLGDRLPNFGGANFTPHVITVQTGQDVAMKILSFSQQEARAICILSASGSISNVTLLQPNSSGGTLTYEGRFEILSLSGSFMPTDNGVVKSRSGGMSVSLAGPDGRVLGGGLAGVLVAASPVQVVLGSFIPANHHQENKPKKQRMESTPITPVIPAVVNPIQDGAYTTHTHTQKLNFTSPPPPSFLSKNPPTQNQNQNQNSRDMEMDNNNGSSEGESDDFGDDDDDDNSPVNIDISG